MKILLATDVFPPRCGGSGWSTYYLAKALRSRGHTVVVVRAATSLRQRAAYTYDGFLVRCVALPTPAVPVLRNVLKNELFWQRATDAFATILRDTHCDIVHGQHVMTIPPAVRAARQLGVPMVATVRDYWPTCPISTRLRPDGICPRCSTDRLTECLAHHRAPVYPLVRVFQGYVEANRRRRQAALAAADRVLAVSTYVADDLRLHAGIDADIVPNMVDLPPLPLPPPDGHDPARPRPVVYVGKLDRHKGADRLPTILAPLASITELIVIGDGPLRATLAAELHERGVAARFFWQLPNQSVLAWLDHAAAVVTPGRWPEPLSRVWLEALSVGCPIVATPYGGAPDAIIHGETGLLAEDDARLASHLQQLVCNDSQQRAMGEQALRLARSRFATPLVVDQVERLYAGLTSPRRVARN